jgi:hypothetical protein
MMMRVVTTYDRLTWKSAKTGNCPVCGKRMRRQKTFSQTQNPFNKNPDGTVKTRQEIYRSLGAEVKAWLAEPMPPHEACSEAAERDLG